MTMQLVEVYNPNLDLVIKYKVLNGDAIEHFLDSLDIEDLSDEDMVIQKILELVIQNLRQDVAPTVAQMNKDEGIRALDSLYNGSIMLNPGLDPETWIALTSAEHLDEDEADELVKRAARKKSAKTQKSKKYRISKKKFQGLLHHLTSFVMGQDEAMEHVSAALKRNAAGINDPDVPLGVFLFAGPSGTGKTSTAKELHKYLFGSEMSMIRIDCGEYQHKHENQKLLGSPQGYVGHDPEGGVLVKQVKKNPQAVLLFDEVEKAHPDLWDTFLRVFDEGTMETHSGETISFKNMVIIMTTNLGNSEVSSQLRGGVPGFLASTPTDKDISSSFRKAIEKHFRPEFLNRVEKVIHFKHLGKEDLIGIANLEMGKLETVLSRKGISLDWTDDVLDHLAEEGYDKVEGARRIGRIRKDTIEDLISDVLLEERCPRGTRMTVSYKDDEFNVEVKKPTPKKRKRKTEE